MQKSAGGASARSALPTRPVGPSGDDVVDYSAQTVTNRPVIVYAGSGNDTLKGGAGVDTFHFNAADLTAGDTVAGGAGLDLLYLDTAGTVSAASLANVTGIDRFYLANGIVQLHDRV